MTPRKQDNDNITRLHNNPPIEWENTYVVRTLLQGEVIAAIKQGQRVSWIARACSLSPGTVSRLAYGETKDPRSNTVIVLLRHFGYKVMIH